MHQREPLSLSLSLSLCLSLPLGQFGIREAEAEKAGAEIGEPVPSVAKQRRDISLLIPILLPFSLKRGYSERAPPSAPLSRVRCPFFSRFHFAATRAYSAAAL